MDKDEEINGYYDDDGNKINMDLVKIPGPCLVCKNYENPEPEEEMLCNLNRLDHHLRKEEDFQCYTFVEKNKE
jgi:hypothetical protein